MKIVECKTVSHHYATNTLEYFMTACKMPVNGSLC